jgi:hypothetical protein
MDVDTDADSDSDADTDADSDGDGNTIEGDLVQGGSYELPLSCVVRLYGDVGALTDPNLFQSPVTVDAWPKAYVLDDVFGPRSGYVGAICDTNGDGSVDSSDTAGGWYGAPDQVSEAATGIDITIASIPTG